MKEIKGSRERAEGKPAQAATILAAAYRRFWDGNATAEDAQVIMTDLANLVGEFRPPSFADWMKRTKAPTGYELHCALYQARREVFQHIMALCTLSDDEMIKLERAARIESGN